MPPVRLPYVVVCILLGLAIGWLPALFHGPIPYKFNIRGMEGTITVWAWYTARMSIGVLIGISVLPRAWYLRGPLCGLLCLFPVGFVALSNPGCGVPCMFWNEVTGGVAGALIAGIAFLLTGRHHAHDKPAETPMADSAR